MKLVREIGEERVEVVFNTEEREIDDRLEKRNKLYFSEMGELERAYHVYPSSVSKYYRKNYRLYL